MEEEIKIKEKEYESFYLEIGKITQITAGDWNAKNDNEDEINQGNLIFMFKANKEQYRLGDDYLYSIVVRKNNDYTPINHDYCVSICTLNNIVIYSCVPFEFLSSEITDILLKYGVEESVRENYKYLLEDLKEK